MFLFTTLQVTEDARKSFHLSQPIFSNDYYYLVSYNNLYTNYEKLTFPFDSPTWILLFLTLGLTFGITMVLSFCPLWIKEIVFGKGINNPAYNALGDFFGISQARLPRENFRRFILMIFILFCMIIRNCWQSKMFEFMTSDMRKPLPKTIEDLKKMNYTIVIFHFVLFNDEIIRGRDGPKVEEENWFLFPQIYKRTLDGSEKRKYAFFVDTFHHAALNSSFNKSLPVMENEKLTKPWAFRFFTNSIIYQPLNGIVDQLIPSGILQHQIDYDRWYLHRPPHVEVKDHRKILSMPDLEFGFVIFLGFLSLSIVVFICELHALYVKRQLRKLLGLYEFLRIVKERLRVYHDKW